MRRLNNEGVSPLIGFIIAVVLFTASFYYLVQTSVEREGDTTGADNANYSEIAQSLANVVMEPGVGWYSSAPCLGTVPNTGAFHPDGVGQLDGSGKPVGRFGLGDESCQRSPLDSKARNNLSFDKFENLNKGLNGRDNTNGHVDYPEARDSLGLTGRNVDFHLRSWPVLPSVQEILGTGIQDPNMRVLYIGDYSETHGNPGSPAPTHVIVKDTSTSDRVVIKYWIRNDGTTTVGFTIIFSIQTNSPIDVPLHSKILAPGESQELSFTLLKTADWAWRSPGGVATPRIDWQLYGKTSKLATGSIDMTGINMAAYASNRLQLFLDTDKSYYPPFTPSVSYEAYTGTGSNNKKTVKWSDWRLHILKPDGSDLMTKLLTNSVQSGVVAYAIAPVGAYNARLESDDGSVFWNNDTINIVATPPDSYTPAGGTASVTVNPPVADETRFIDLLISHFDRNVYSSYYGTQAIPYAPGGDIYPDIKSVMDNDLALALRDAGGAATLANYNTLIVGSQVDHNAMTSGSAKHTIAEWVEKGGTMIVFGSTAQNVQWLQPLFHASLDSGSGGLYTPDGDNPILNVPNQLDYATYNADSVWNYNAGYDELFTHVVQQGGDLLGLNDPGAFGDGSVILSGWQPYELTDDQSQTCPAVITEGSQCQALFLIDNLITMTYRNLFLDYGPPIPLGAANGVQTRIASIQHPQLTSLVTVNLQTFAFAGNVMPPATAATTTPPVGSSCNSDHSAPTVDIWNQSPVDVSDHTSGAVLVTITVVDDCAGVDDAVSPEFWYRFQDGTNPPLVDLGPMTLVATDQWRASLPDPGWLSKGGRTLQYEVHGLQDNNGNNGDTSQQSDVIEIGCAADTSPPTVNTWLQAPADIRSSTTGATSVTATLIDGCWGVDTAANPELHYRVNDGTNPAFTNAGAMTPTGVTNQWQKSIPDPTWASKVGQTLEYEVALMKDLGGHTGTSTRQGDVIQQDCPGDVTPPTVNTWSQVPADVLTSTSGTVSISATLTDDCAVDDNSNPNLYYRLNDGTNPSFTNAGSMTRIATHQWSLAIPDLTWASQSGKTLDYELRFMKDFNGNSGTSTRQSDLVQAPAAVDTYVSSNTITTGTLSNFANAQSASDSDASATFSEGQVNQAMTLTLGAASVDSGQTDSCWTGTGNGYVSDNAYASCATQNKNLQYALADHSYASGTITSVILKVEASITTASDDGFKLKACFGSTCSTQSGQLTVTSSDATYSYDVSGLRPGGGSWTVTDINNLEINIDAVKTGSQDGTWRVDLASVQVGCTCRTYQTSGVFQFASVPSGTTQSLQLRYSTAVDTYDVKVWDGASYVVKGATLNSAGFTTWSYTLTSAEYNGGAPKIQIVDRSTTGATQGTLTLDYVRITTT